MNETRRPRKRKGSSSAGGYADRVSQALERLEEKASLIDDKCNAIVGDVNRVMQGVDTLKGEVDGIYKYLPDPKKPPEGTT